MSTFNKLVQEVSERRKRLAEERLQQRRTSTESKGRGKVVASYYSFENLMKLNRVAEQAGVAVGGLQHDLVMECVDGILAEATGKDALQKSKDALQELAKLVKEDQAGVEKTIQS